MNGTNGSSNNNNSSYYDTHNVFPTSVNNNNNQDTILYDSITTISQAQNTLYAPSIGTAIGKLNIIIESLSKKGQGKCFNENWCKTSWNSRRIRNFYIFNAVKHARYEAQCNSHTHRPIDVSLSCRWAKRLSTWLCTVLANGRSEMHKVIMRITRLVEGILLHNFD